MVKTLQGVSKSCGESLEGAGKSWLWVKQNLSPEAMIRLVHSAFLTVSICLEVHPVWFGVSTRALFLDKRDDVDHKCGCIYHTLSPLCENSWKFHLHASLFDLNTLTLSVCQCTPLESPTK